MVGLQFHWDWEKNTGKEWYVQHASSITMFLHVYNEEVKDNSKLQLMTYRSEQLHILIGKLIYIASEQLRCRKIIDQFGLFHLS